MTEDQRASILAAVSASDYKKSPKAKNWVGCAVAYAVGLDLDDNVQRKRAARLVTALIREGALVEPPSSVGERRHQGRQRAPEPVRSGVGGIGRLGPVEAG